ncbi:hypothetical protein ACQVP2_13130 [Methylobacterium aquaticum]|uniref:hypothetical protein n=1 Tax=Methylobacterium aquaticum TaxID=270351 RepID=UPI003D1726AA
MIVDRHAVPAREDAAQTGERRVAEPPCRVPGWDVLGGCSRQIFIAEAVTGSAIKICDKTRT